MREVYIVGGGPSLHDFNFRVLENKHTIGVNKSAFSLKYPTYFITMDYTFLRKIGLNKMLRLECTKFFVVNTTVPYLSVQDGMIVDTRGGGRLNTYKDIYTCMDSIILCRDQEGIGCSIHDFRCGNNSGYCALQLAVALGYDVIYLLGMDFRIYGNKTHFHTGYSQHPTRFSAILEKYVAGFKNALAETKEKCPSVKIYNCSPMSLLKDVLPYRALSDIE
jgi:hypothetical protein